MSQVGEPSPAHVPFKQFALKATDYAAKLFKGAALIVLVASVSLVLYLAFTDQRRWIQFHCPECLGPNRDSAPEPCDETRNVSDHGPTNISHVVFAIGASARTWHDRRQYSELWWQPNVTRGYVWLDEEPDPNTTWPDNSPPYRVSEDWTRFRYSSSQSAVRMARIVLESFRVGPPDARWFVMGDDDTVFFTDNLVSLLSNYDHRRLYYVGGNSESVEQDVMHSYDMAFGGGGFAISRSLAAELARILDGCLDRYYGFYGSDQRIWACVNEIGVSLTKERGFHQIDIRGDAYGLLAAHPLAPLVSLHHLDAVNPLFPAQTRLRSLQMLFRANRADPARLLQQSFCYHHHPKHNWSVSISWGYTAQIYPSLLTASELATPLRTFQTWRSWSSGPFTFNTRPVNPDPCEQPVVYFADKVEEVGPRQTLTTYKINVAESQKKCGRPEISGVKRIVVFAPKMDPVEWKKAPRRQRCEVIEILKKTTMRVRIRRFKQWETITTSISDRTSP
ncbi:uncharacterized protein LOC127790638 [Diospyros lotus]|uniref:uncharacterized protein LOC127790638 n=1 Tax=Diospyros lotus TaxID=55363 RepID=UPI002259C4B8|nr:uncharacterized protein LOC127790638 [Diospyros lotus]